MHPPKMNKDGWYEYGGPAFLETRTLGNPSRLFRNTWWLDMNDERSYNRELLGEDQERHPACSYGIYDRRDYRWRKMFTLTWGTSQKRTAMGCLAERRQLVVTLLQIPEFGVIRGILGNIRSLRSFIACGSSYPFYRTRFQVIAAGSHATTVAVAPAFSKLNVARVHADKARPVSKDRPPHDVFLSVDVVPSPSHLTLDFIKLAAQFVARHWSEFVQKLTEPNSSKH
jgi:hypothetical protein